MHRVVQDAKLFCTSGSDFHGSKGRDFGKSDEEFQKTIKLIDSKILDLANRIKDDFK